MAKLENLLECSKKFDHWYWFHRFCTLEIRSGGPDPHMKVTIQIAKNDKVDWAETAWRGLCYLGVYNVPCSVAIYQEFPWERSKADSRKIPIWLEKNWKEGITLRRERKCVRSPTKLGKYLTTAVSWLQEKEFDKITGGGWMFQPGISTKDRHNLGWDDVQRIYAMGRYVAIKYLEFSSRVLGVDCAGYDIRAKGGWSPREGLTLLWPEHAESLMGDDSPKNVKLTEDLARKTKERMNQDFNLDLDYFNLQVLLCDYKQCVYGQRQFPGRSQDSEIVYDKKISGHWGNCEKMYVARKQIFPHQVLGELQGWDRVREELGDCLAEHKYMWSDFIYDYHKSKSDISRPYLLDGSRVLKKDPPAPPDLKVAQISVSGSVSPPAKGLGPAGFKVHAIIPNRIYQRGKFRSLSIQKKTLFLKQLGIGSVVCTAGSSIDKDMEQVLGNNYYYLPLPDGQIKKSRLILSKAREVGDWLEEDGTNRVLVHCQAGRNRSSLFSSLLVIRLLNISGKQVVEYIRKKRPNALANEHFVKFLESVVCWDRTSSGYILEK